MIQKSFACHDMNFQEVSLISHVIAVPLTSHEESPLACHGARRRGRPWRRTDCCLSEPPSGDASTPRRCRKGGGSLGRDCWADWTGPPKTLKSHQVRQFTMIAEEKMDGHKRIKNGHETDKNSGHSTGTLNVLKRGTKNASQKNNDNNLQMNNSSHDTVQVRYPCKRKSNDVITAHLKPKYPRDKQPPYWHQTK